MWEPFQAMLTNFIPNLDKGAEELQLSLFHTTFNIINTLLMLGFVPLIAKIVTRIVPVTAEDDEDYRLEYIGNPVKTPELSILEAQKEVAKFGEVTSRMSLFTQKLLMTTKAKKQAKWLKKLSKYEEITDSVEIEMTEYLTKISREEVTPKTSITIRSILNICNDLERIGDIYYQMSKTIEKKIEDKIWFNQHQRDRLTEMFSLIDQAFDIMVENLRSDSYDNVDKQIASAMEQKINEHRNLMRKENLEHMSGPDYNVNSAMIYNNLFSSMEKIGDHIINVTEAIVGEI